MIASLQFVQLLGTLCLIAGLALGYVLFRLGSHLKSKGGSGHL